VVEGGAEAVNRIRTGLYTVRNCNVCYTDLSLVPKLVGGRVCSECWELLEGLAFGQGDALPKIVAKRNCGSRRLRGLADHNDQADRGTPNGPTLTRDTDFDFGA